LKLSAFHLIVLAAGPLMLGILVLTVYPETADRAPNDLNPEDGDVSDSA